MLTKEILVSKGSIKRLTNASKWVPKFRHITCNNRFSKTIVFWVWLTQTLFWDANMHRSLLPHQIVSYWNRNIDFIMNISKCFHMWWKTILPQSHRIGLLTSIMVWKHLIFVWLIIVMHLTFLICWLGLNSMYAKPFLKHPSCKWEVSVVL